ncbi:adhesin [Rosenbergiella nectarea]|uniref:adhesin n=1 Tax=Rosenbergiella nectarea TaxID=988801 RepID=UPI0030B9053A
MTVENNWLSLPSGMADYGQSASSLAMSMAQQGATPDEINAALSQHVKGDLPEGANITKAIVEGYTDGLLIAGAWYLGPAASVGKVIGGGIIAEIANGSYQWFDLSRPGNENKSWDWKSSVSSGISGMLAPGRTVQQNVGIAVGGAVFTDGPDMGSIGIAAGGTGLGWAFGEHAPRVFNSLTGKEVPGFVFDAIGSLGTEFLGGYTKDLLNAPVPQNPPEKTKEGEK